jgi:hypothetical protein
VNNTHSRAQIRLSRRERRLLRRLEDRTFAEDPLLDVRLGAATTRTKRAAVRLRRLLKAVCRALRGRASSAALGVVGIALVLASLVLSKSITVAALLAVPCAFVLGASLPRRPTRTLAAAPRRRTKRQASTRPDRAPLQ